MNSKKIRPNSITLIGLLVFTSSCCYKNIALQNLNIPVHPLVLKNLLPALDGGKIVKCEGLDDQFNQTLIQQVLDNTIANKGSWYRSDVSDRGYLEYHLISRYKKMDCLIVREFDGALANAYVCFLKVKCREACIEGILPLDNLRDNLIKISGSELFIGSTKYNIAEIIHGD